MGLALGTTTLADQVTHYGRIVEIVELFATKNVGVSGFRLQAGFSWCFQMGSLEENSCKVFAEGHVG